MPDFAHSPAEPDSRLEDCGRYLDLPFTAAHSSGHRSALHGARDRVVLFRFDDDVASDRIDLGHRILFSAREEDEHPDLVGIEDFG